MRIQIRMTKTTNLKNVTHGPFMLPKVAGKIFLTITCMHTLALSGLSVWK